MAGTCSTIHPEREKLNSNESMGAARPGSPQVSLYPQQSPGDTLASP